MARISVQAGGLRIGDRFVPLLSGEVQFWRLDPAHWAPALDAVRDAGIPIVATYLSWRRHAPDPERPPDFSGRSDPRLNVTGFLDLCRQQGLWVHLKPGPWICAEEPGGGYPDWLLADAALYALDAAGRPVAGYNPPFKHPVPCYLHPRYLRHARAWLQAVDHSLVGYFYPRGPIVALQLDNEPSYCFQDGFLGADYHPVALSHFRRRLLRRYGSLERLSRAWEQPLANLEAVDPPRAVVPAPPGSGPWQRQQDWTEFREWLLAEHLRRLRRIHARAGAGHLLFTVNCNAHPVTAVPQDAARLQRAARGLAGEDLYYVPPLRRAHLTRVAYSAACARATGTPLPWAPEIQAGIWRSPGERVDHPDPTAAQQTLYWLAALAFGLRGLNFYMLVNRENWELAPLGPDGTPGPTLNAVRWTAQLVYRLSAWPALQPEAPVALLWHRPWARDAYAAASGPESAAAAAGAPAGDGASAYVLGEAAFAALLAAGYLPALWDTARPEPPPGTRAVVVPAGPGLPLAVQRRLRRLAAAGTPLIHLAPPPGGSGPPGSAPAAALARHQPGLLAAPAPADLPVVLRQAGVQPPVASDRPDALAVLQQGGGHRLLWLLYPGTAPARLRLAFGDVAEAALLRWPSGPGGGVAPEVTTIAQGVAEVAIAPCSATIYEILPRRAEDEPTNPGRRTALPARGCRPLGRAPRLPHHR